jgi:hypothetical protein
MKIGEKHEQGTASGSWSWNISNRNRDVRKNTLVDIRELHVGSYYREVDLFTSYQ